MQFLQKSVGPFFRQLFANKSNNCHCRSASTVSFLYANTTMESFYKIKPSAPASSATATNNKDLQGNDLNDVEIDVDKIAKVYTETVRHASVISGRIDEDGNSGCLSIYTEWFLDDVSKKEKTQFAKTYTVIPAGVGKAQNHQIISSGPIPFESKLTVTSNSGNRKAVLIGKKPKSGNGAPGDDDEELLQIFNRDGLLKTYNLKELDMHKGVYTHSFWGTRMAWSPDESKLIYLAGKKPPKPTPFFTSYSKFSKEDSEAPEIDPAKAAEKEKAKGEEFAFQQTWGEQLAQAKESVIVLLDLNQDKFKIVEIPDKLFPSDLQWVGNEGIIGTAYTITDWRLGLIFCSNRESRIFQIGLNRDKDKGEGNDFRFLSEPGLGANSPRVRPDSKYVVWLERELSPQHRSAFQLVGSSLPDISYKILHPFNPSNKIPLYQELPHNTWSKDGTKLYVVTPNGITDGMIEFEIKEDGTLGKVSSEVFNIHGIMWVGSDYILAATGDSLNPNTPILIERKEKNYSLVDLEPNSKFPQFQNIRLLVVPGSVSPDSFYYGPSGDDIKAGSIPLLVMAHGGPHSVYTDSFASMVAFFLQLGFGVLRINYVGSTGGSKDNTGLLVGNVGTKDVADCQKIVEKLLETEPLIDQNKIVYFGGSHGGFLGAHLSSSYPDTYKAVVLLNPVTDLLSMVGTTDITDWCFAVAGIPYDPKNPTTILPTIQDPELALQLMKCSPIRYVEKVKAPTLLLLGTEDLRVPSSQGKAYYRALIAAGKTAEIRMYADNHPLGKTEHSLDCEVHTAVWFLKYLKQST